MKGDGIPDDATGGALRRLLRDGSDFSKPHEIDFHVAVPDESAGRHVADAASKLGFATKVVYDDENGPSWTCWCSRWMLPDHAAITQIEKRLDDIAQPVGGKIDGWGAFVVS